MTKRDLLRLKNEMLAANFLANIVGVFLVEILILGAESPLPDHVFQNPVVDFIDWAFTPSPEPSKFESVRALRRC